MAILFIALFVFVLLTLGAGGLLVVVSRRLLARTASVKMDGSLDKPSVPELGFRWRYVLLPVVVAVISMAVAAYFYGLLPVDISYRFAADGTGETFTGRTGLVITAVAVQLLLAVLAAGVAHVVARLGNGFLSRDVGRMPVVESVIVVMSNMVVLPQVVLFFAMLDVFSYNAFQHHLVEPWIVALVAMLVGGPVLAILLFRAIRGSRAAKP
jgi:uncharacterized membrane protein